MEDLDKKLKLNWSWNVKREWNLPSKMAKESKKTI